MVEYSVFPYYPQELILRDYYPERAVYYNDEEKIAWIEEGCSCAVGIEPEMIQRYVCVHNHPDNSPISPGDVMMACYFSAKEMRVTTRSYLYSMKPLVKWDISLWECRLRRSIDFYGNELGIFDDVFNLDYCLGFNVEEEAQDDDCEYRMPIELVEKWNELWWNVCDECSIDFKIMKWEDKDKQLTERKST